jgi:hypothetical protein
MTSLAEVMFEAVVIIVFLGGLEILLFWMNKKDLQEQNDEMANQTEILEEIADVAAGLADKELHNNIEQEVRRNLKRKKRNRKP